MANPDEGEKVEREADVAERESDAPEPGGFGTDPEADTKPNRKGGAPAHARPGESSGPA